MMISMWSTTDCSTPLPVVVNTCWKANSTRITKNENLFFLGGWGSFSPDLNNHVVTRVGAAEHWDRTGVVWNGELSVLKKDYGWQNDRFGTKKGAGNLPNWCRISWPIPGTEFWLSADRSTVSEKFFLTVNLWQIQTGSIEWPYSFSIQGFKLNISSRDLTSYGLLFLCHFKNFFKN